jgi:hypothetical protein
MIIHQVTGGLNDDREGIPLDLLHGRRFQHINFMLPLQSASSASRWPLVMLRAPRWRRMPKVATDKFSIACLARPRQRLSTFKRGLRRLREKQQRQIIHKREAVQQRDRCSHCRSQ